jgi:uncharacterized protein YbjT (DUF2867 family)
MSVVLVTGGTGTLGRLLVPALQAGGHDVRVLSRRPGAGTHTGDLATGEGVEAAAAGAEVIVHLASDRRLGRTDEEQTARLLAAAQSCHHLLYLSIVGVDAIPFGYYQRKLACERLIAASDIPSTVLRATQFHELLAMVLGTVGRSPLAVLPLDMIFQPVAAADVAARLAQLVDGPPLVRAPDFGGPEVLTGWQIAGAWRARYHRPGAVLSVRFPGPVYRAFADGLNTCPEHADGRQRWADYVTSRS